MVCFAMLRPSFPLIIYPRTSYIVSDCGLAIDKFKPKMV
jgi:hypothetical protein